MNWPPIDSMWGADGFRVRVVDVVNTAELGPVVYGVIQPWSNGTHTYRAAPVGMLLEAFLDDYVRATS